MNNKKVIKLVNNIEASLRALAAETGEDHISAAVINGGFILTSFENENGQVILDFYRGGADNAKNAENTESTTASI